MTSGTTRTSENYVVTVSGGVFEAPARRPDRRGSNESRCGKCNAIFSPFDMLKHARVAGDEISWVCPKCNVKYWISPPKKKSVDPCWDLPR